MKKKLLYVVSANLVFLVIGLLSNFILPKFLSLETYADIKTYTLFIGYAGFFSLGYNDGMFLKYGGKEIGKISRRDLQKNFYNYFILEVLMTGLIIAVSILLDDKIILFFGIGMLCENINGYYKSLYQATGEFKAYGKALNLQKILLFVIEMLFIFGLKNDKSNDYLLATVAVSLVTVVILTVELQRISHMFTLKNLFLLSEIQSNISAGLVLMLGNFSSGIFTGIDRWFVKGLLSTKDFALYAFAVSTENLINVFITPISVSMYHTFCQHRDFDYVKKIKRLTLVWGFIVIATAFPVKFILTNYMEKYTGAINIVFYLFSAQAFYAVIKGVYVNIYKAEKQQDRYFKQMLIMIVIAVVLNIACFWIIKSFEAFAVGTMLTAIIWLIICEYDNRIFAFTFKEYCAMFLGLVVYLICGKYFNAVLGLTLYLIAAMMILIIFMRNTIQDTINIIHSTIKQKVG